MRHVDKPNNATNVKLEQEIENGNPATSEEATRRWKNFNGKTELSRQLLQQQYGLCCYTELNLTDFALELHMGTHIEHERPKSMFPDRTFDYGNLLLCSLTSEDLKHFPGQQQFGGHFKGSNFVAASFVSPHQANCRDYFIYSSGSGEISPNLALPEDEQQKAQYTIDLLNLNAPFLRAERQQWLEEIEECLEPLIDSGDLQSIELLAETELTPAQRHDAKLGYTCEQLRKFHSAVRAVFGQLGEQVIQEHCPNI
ncbi:TPA: retron system putative HNH endonuclease [Vibrio parahaemolyticus]|uniref:retron system putative HNH endonuclease n=1 Tax=Vibrio parahaemolyticus TaxID=670 RepID=UPI001D160457|nr:retron system putative HNH endonuclease [Vibrio parahaemolyticus]MCC3790732.1 TIGR02646 family protein [Vibrio parahaemolyticus]